MGATRRAGAALGSMLQIPQCLRSDPARHAFTQPTGLPAVYEHSWTGPRVRDARARARRSLPKRSGDRKGIASTANGMASCPQVSRTDSSETVRCGATAAPSLNLRNAQPDNSCANSSRLTGRLSVPGGVGPRAPQVVRKLFFPTRDDGERPAMACGWPTTRRDGGRWLSRTARQSTNRHPDSPFAAPREWGTSQDGDRQPQERPPLPAGQADGSWNLGNAAGAGRLRYAENRRRFALQRQPLGRRPPEGPSIVVVDTACDVRRWSRSGAVRTVGCAASCASEGLAAAIRGTDAWPGVRSPGTMASAPRLQRTRRHAPRRRPRLRSRPGRQAHP